MSTRGSAAASEALVSEVSRRTALRRVGGGGLGVGLSLVLGREIAAVAQEATPTGECRGDLTGEFLSRQVSAALAAKAKEVALDIDVKNVAFSALGNDLVALAPTVRSVRAFTTPGPVAFSYFSFSAIDCGDVVSGYYTLELAHEDDLAPLDQLYPGTYEVTMRIVNLNGEVVGERPFTREVMRMHPGEVPGPHPPPTVGVELRESAVRMGAIEVIAKTHDHDSRAGWDWWIWVFGPT